MRKKVLFILVMILLITSGCNVKSSGDECCECLDCPECDVCCSCSHPYISK